jgi:hypothetical protein
LVQQGDEADEGRLEASRSTVVAKVIVNEGKVVRPSLIASVRQTWEDPAGALARGGDEQFRARRIQAE